MPGPKTRHGCLTAYLVAMIVLNAITALIYLLANDMVIRGLPGAGAWVLPVLTAGAVFNIVCSVALWRWKKWGFYGFLATSVVALGVNISIGLNPLQVILGLAGVAILYGVLQIGGENKGWPQLE